MKKAIHKDQVVMIVRTGGKNTRVHLANEDRTKSFLVANTDLTNIEVVEEKMSKAEAEIRNSVLAKTEERPFLNVVSLEESIEEEHAAEEAIADGVYDDEDDTVLDVFEHMQAA